MKCAQTWGKFVEGRDYPIWNERGVVMGVRDMDQFLGRWEMDVPGVRRRMILAPMPRERALR